jgi:hypothetical protein
MFEIFDIMFEVSTLSILVASISVVIGVIFAILEVRRSVRTRNMDLVMRIVLATLSKEFRQALIKINRSEFKNYEDYVNTAEPEAQQIGGFFEGLGLLIHKKIVDIDLVGDLWDPTLTWEKLKLYAQGVRKEVDDPRVYEWFEYFANEMQKRKQQLTTIQ